MTTIQDESSISFVVAAFNVEAYIQGTLDSLYAALLPGDEIVVVDDGSRDATAERVMSHPAHLAGRVNLVKQHNQGIAATRLSGLTSAVRSYIWFFDGEDLLHHEHLPALRLVLRKLAPEIVLFDFNFYWSESGGRLARSPARTHPPMVLARDTANWVSQAYDDAIPALWSRVARRTLYERVLPKRLPLWARYEDVAASPHVLAAASTFFYLPLPLVKYRQVSGSLSTVQSLEACENLIRSAMFGTEARLSLATEALGGEKVAHAAWRMLARKAVEAIRRAAEDGATADEILEKLVHPMLQVMGADVAETVRELQASTRCGDRRIADHLHQMKTRSRWYATSRVLVGRYHRLRRR